MTKPTFLKTAGWLFLVAMLIVHAYLALHLEDYIHKGYADFTIFYSVGKIIHEGPRSNLYDGDLQYRVQKRFAPNVKIRQAALPYNHPPFEALLFLPLIGFSYIHAYLLWNLFNVVILCAVPIFLRDHVAILRTRPLWFWVLLALAFFPVFITLLQGQDSIFLLLVFVLTFVFLKKNADFIAGCCLGLGLFRFHMVLPFAFILLLQGRKKAILGFSSVAACWFLISVGLVGWNTVIHYPQYVMQLEIAGAGGAIAPVNMPTIHGLVDPVIAAQLGKITSVVIVGILSALLVLSSVFFRSSKSEQTHFDLSFALAVLITVLVSYHAYAHDLSVLLLPLLLMSSHMQELPLSAIFRSGNMLTPMILLWLSPLYMFLWFRYQHLNLVGLVILWLTWALWREIRRRSKTMSPELRGAS